MVQMMKILNVVFRILKKFPRVIIILFLLPVIVGAIGNFAPEYILKEPIVLEGTISDWLSDEIIVWNGKIKLNVSVRNTGKHNFVSDNSVIPDYENFSYLRTYFQDQNWKIYLDEKSNFPSPIYPNKENDSATIPLIIDVPEDLKEWKLIIEVYCKNNLSRRCNSHIEKIQHHFKKNDAGPFKILIVDAAGKSHIHVGNFRKNLEDTLGGSFILKSAWSEEVFGKEAFWGALLYYNPAKNHSDISPLTQLVRNILLDTYSHLEGKIKIAEFDLKTIDWSYVYLSDCSPDNCENNSNWLNLDLYSNRFSPLILARNLDIDIIIFLPY